MTAKILILDIETAPIRAFVWGRWQQNVAMNQIISHSYVLCWSAMWYGSDEVLYDALNFHDLYHNEPQNDREIIQSMWELLDEADIIVAHNGDKFDIPVLNSRFLEHGLQPPSYYRKVDTYKIAKSKFRLPSNRLDDLGQLLGCGAKLATGGFELWSDIVDKKCKDAWKRMIDYNIRDVELLNDVYTTLRPWDNKHPNLSVYSDHQGMSCSSCGNHTFHSRGYYTTQSARYQVHRCTKCGKSHRRVTKEQPASKPVIKPI